MATDGKFKDFHEAYWWLYEHPIFQYEYDLNPMLDEKVMDSFFERAIDMDVVKVNPENNTIEDDVTLNTKTQVWIEMGGDYDRESHCCQMHNWYLDTGGDTYEEAIISVAKRVWKYFKNGSEFIVDPWGENQSEYEEDNGVE